MSIRAQQIPELFDSLEPFELTSSGFKLKINASMFSVLANILNIANDAIDTLQIKNNAVTDSKLASGSVTASKIGFTASDIIYSGMTTVKNILDVALLTTGIRPMVGDLDLDDNKVINVKEPTDASDAATKNYVDSKFDLSGYFWARPTLLNQLQATWVRAMACYYCLLNPSDGDQITIQGVTFTFVSSVVNPDDILIGGSLSVTIANALSVMAASTTLTTNGLPFNVQFESDSFGQYIYFIVLNEDPPNNPEDGNSQNISVGSGCTAIKVAWGFNGGRTLTEKDYGLVFRVLDDPGVNHFRFYTYGLGYTAG